VIANTASLAFARMRGGHTSEDLHFPIQNRLKIVGDKNLLSMGKDIED